MFAGVIAATPTCRGSLGGGQAFDRPSSTQPGDWVNRTCGTRVPGKRSCASASSVPCRSVEHRFALVPGVGLDCVGNVRLGPFPWFGLNFGAWKLEALIHGLRRRCSTDSPVGFGDTQAVVTGNSEYEPRRDDAGDQDHTCYTHTLHSSKTAGTSANQHAVAMLLNEISVNPPNWSATYRPSRLADANPGRVGSAVIERALLFNQDPTKLYILVAGMYTP